MGVGSGTKQAAGLIGFWDQRVANSIGTFKRRTLEGFLPTEWGLCRSPVLIRRGREAEAAQTGTGP